jgi:hypothetical protein
MSFNLKEKQARTILEAQVKVTEKMLEDSFSQYDKLIKTETLEVNIGKDRTEKEPDSIMEANLKPHQIGTEIGVTEKKLNEEKGMYNTHRVDQSGDIPLLEKRRLERSPVEKVDYKKANE